MNINFIKEYQSQKVTRYENSEKDSTFTKKKKT